MRTTIITSAVAIALTAASVSAGNSYVVVEQPKLGLSGDLGLAYQNKYEFRGATGIAGALADFNDDRSMDNVVIAEVNAGYGFTENFSLLAGATVRTLADSSYDHNSYRIGGEWRNECYSIEVGYQYQDYRSIEPAYHNDELYINFGLVCPWTGADVNLFWAHALTSLNGNGFIKDLDLQKGDYVELNAHKSWELNEWAAADLTLGIAYQNDYWSQGSNFNHWYATFALPLNATEALVFTPYVKFNGGLKGTEDVFGTGYNEGNEWIFGLSAAVNF